jgi:hypothetical protein
MKTSSVVVAMAALPIVSFGAAYGLAKAGDGRGTPVTARSMPACAPGHQRAMDGWSCTDWVLIDPRTGTPDRRRGD